jgi:hypothetical protein
MKADEGQVQQDMFLRALLKGDMRASNPVTSSITIRSYSCNEFDQVLTFWTFSSNEVRAFPFLSSSQPSASTDYD